LNVKTSLEGLPFLLDGLVDSNGNINRYKVAKTEPHTWRVDWLPGGVVELPIQLGYVKAAQVSDTLVVWIYRMEYDPYPNSSGDFTFPAESDSSIYGNMLVNLIEENFQRVGATAMVEKNPQSDIRNSETLSLTSTVEKPQK